MKLAKAFATLIAISTGLITLLGLFKVPGFDAMGEILLGWTSFLVATGIVVGTINLFLVHSKKVGVGAPGWFYSLVLILSLVTVLLVNLAAPFLHWGSGPANAVNQWLFQNIQLTVAAALAGLMFFFLVLAGYRLLQRRPSLTSVTFIVVAIIILAGTVPWPSFLPDLVFLRDLKSWIAQVPAVAGARGLLLGVTLGVIATGLRILLAQDRPYRE